MEPTDELARLRAEVAELKQQMAELRRFLHVDTDPDNPQRKTLHVACSGLTLFSPIGCEHKTQGLLAGGEDGPSFSLFGSNESARIMLRLDQDRGEVRLMDSALKTVAIMADNGSDSYVGVLHQGQPRAQLKATAEFGYVAAVHDDSRARALLCSQFGHGQMYVVGGDMQPAVKLSADGKDGGGYVSVNHANGKSALILTSTTLGGGIISKGTRGRDVAVWPEPNEP